MDATSTPGTQMPVIWYRTWWGRVLLTVLLLVAAFIALGVYGLIQQPWNKDADPASRGAMVAMEKVFIPTAPMIGSATAPLTIIEFGDFLCPVCQRDYTVMRELAAKHPTEVAIYWRHFPVIDPLSVELALASECAHAQGKFWAMHDKFFQQQDTIMVSAIAAVAQQVGLDMTQFNQCYTSRKLVSRVDADLTTAEDVVGARGTPTFVVNGYVISGFVPLETWENIIAASDEGTGQQTNTK